MKPDSLPSVNVIGFGRVGTGLTWSLLKHEIPVKVMDPAINSVTRSLLPEQRVYRELSPELFNGPGPVLWLICVPEDDTEQIISGIVRTDLFNQHKDCIASVSATCDLTKISEKTGITVGRAHPLYPFAPASTGDTVFTGIPFATQDLPAWAINLMMNAGWRPFVLDDQSRNLYHAAAVMVCNLPAALVKAASDIFAQVGVPDPDKQAVALLDSLAGILKSSGIDAVPGPASRNDRKTVAADQNAIDRYNEDLAAVHRILSELISNGKMRAPAGNCRGRLEKQE